MKAQYFDRFNYKLYDQAYDNQDSEYESLKMSPEAEDLIDCLYRDGLNLSDILLELKGSIDWVKEITGHDDDTIEEAAGIVGKLLRSKPAKSKVNW